MCHKGNNRCVQAEHSVQPSVRVKFRLNSEGLRALGTCGSCAPWHSCPV